MLVGTLEFLLPHHKQEILWRTATSKEVLIPEVAWKRAKLLEKELSVLGKEAQPLCSAADRSHQEICNLLVRQMFCGKNPENVDKPVPPHWEYAHNHAMLAFRLYYHGHQLDPNFPAPHPIADYTVPPKSKKVAVSSPPVVPYYRPPNHDDLEGMPTHSAAATPTTTAVGMHINHEDDERRRLLSEVREHLKLLKEFEGIISSEELAQRKRDLFDALPPAPPTKKTAHHQQQHPSKVV